MPHEAGGDGYARARDTRQQRRCLGKTDQQRIEKTDAAPPCAPGGSVGEKEDTGGDKEADANKQHRGEGLFDLSPQQEADKSNGNGGNHKPTDFHSFLSTGEQGAQQPNNIAAEQKQNRNQCSQVESCFHQRPRRIKMQHPLCEDEMTGA